MESATNIISRSVKSIGSTQPLANGQSGANRKTYLEDGELLTVDEILWKRLSRFYGYLFTRQHGLVPTKEWLMAIGGLELSAIGKGLKKMVACGDFKKNPPNAIQFRGLCMPTSEELGLPSYQDAYRMAFGLKTKKHPAVIYMLDKFVDALHMRTEKEAVARRMFDKAWNQTVEYVANGGELPDPVEEIEHKHTPASREFNQARLTALQEVLK